MAKVKKTTAMKKAKKPVKKTAKKTSKKTAKRGAKAPAHKADAAPVIVRAGTFTPAQLKKIRQILQEEHRRLTRRLGGIQSDDSGSDAANVGDIVDAATQQETRAVLQGLQQTERDQLAQVESAIERIDNGTYGHCTRCNEMIEAARLEAIPQVETCIACKKKEENGGFVKSTN